MSGPRLGLAVTGADAAEIARLAPLAEANNLDAMLVGAIRGGAPNSDDTYVVTAAAAAATRTRYLRIAVALDLRGSAPPLRIAEDLGVLDVMSNGRLELVLRPGPEPEWSRDLEAILGAWRAWPLEDPDADPGPGPGGPSGASMPVTPSPVQPEIPTWLMDTCEPPAARPLSRGSSLVFLDWPQPSVAPDAAAIPDAAALREIRRMRDDAGAATVVVDIAGMPPERRAEVIQVLGTVVAPCLRCPDDEVGILALDARDWLVHRTELHRPPLDDPALEEPSDIR